MSRRILLAILLCGLTNLSALAQSYQSSFSELKYDRANGPATVHGGVEVEASTGAVNLSIPLGPGIGARGINFRPVLAGHVAPTVDGRTSTTVHSGVTSYKYSATQNIQYFFSLTPGFLDLALSDDAIGPTGPTIDNAGVVVTNYTLPDGSTGTLNAKSWFPQDPALPSASNLNTILSEFGYASGVTVGQIPYMDGVTLTGNTAFVRRDSNGFLVVGLSGSSPYLTMTNSTISSGGMQGNTESVSTANWNFPQKILAIRGDVAYEFTWEGGKFGTTTDSTAMPTPITLTVLRSAHYRLSAILNRFGESISFVYALDGASYTASIHLG